MSKRNRETIDEWEHRVLRDDFVPSGVPPFCILTRGELLDAIERGSFGMPELKADLGDELS